MLTYKNAIKAFAIVLTAMIAFDYFLSVPVGLYFILILLFFMVIFYGSYFIHSNFFIPAVCHGNRKSNKVAITFDDGPSPQHTTEILDILKANNVNAAFFCIGKNIQSNPELTKRIIAEGHMIGNHSYSHHFFFDFFSRMKMINEIDTTNHAVANITGTRPIFFRPPYGVTTPVLAKAIQTAGMITIGWSLRSMDTVTKEKNRLVTNIGSKLRGGDILLLHDTEKVTAAALQDIIELIKQKGLEVVRLDHLVNSRVYA